MRAIRFAAVLGTILTLAAPAAALAALMCCSCTPPNGTAMCLTIDESKVSATGSCTTLPSIVGDSLKGWTCAPDRLSTGACQAAPVGSCPVDPVDAFAAQAPGQVVRPAGTGTAPNADQPIAPHLNVPIPGLTFSVSQGGDDSSLLAQYISASYRYLISISAIAATIMFTYGAFMYLLGSAIPSLSSGKRIMQDAVIGMLLVLSIVLILRTINPQLVQFKSLSVLTITPYSDYEASTIPQGDSAVTSYTAPHAVCQASGCAQYCSGCTFKTPLPDAPWIPTADQLATITPAPGISTAGVGHPQLRKEAVDALARAGQAALTAAGGPYTLHVGEAYRPLDGQMAAACQFLCGQTQKHFASPGASMHGTGLAVDVSLWKNGAPILTPQDPLSMQATNISETNARALQQIMGSTGWVQYCPEIWHWEYGVPEGGEKSKHCPWPPPAPK